jgi:hypothetical protein
MAARFRALFLVIVLVAAVGCSGSDPWRERTGQWGLTYSPSDLEAGSLLLLAHEPVDFDRDVAEFSVESVEPQMGSGLSFERAGVFNMAPYPLGRGDVLDF